MSDVAIRVEGLGKRYRLGQRESYQALRDVLAAAMRAPARQVGAARRDKGTRGPGDQGTGTPARVPGKSAGHLTAGWLWALKNVAFEVKHGEVVGIIGRNGAGKSTLLKILSRITRPSEGAADLYGRVGSLLEVGTGFHPELTGRENIYLNGAILGMKRAEIDRRFDEIVAFAEVERFLDTPVKRYSSGMYVRLAFAVAAHLEPEILIVDEVLAVGDAQFQKKCLGKMQDVAGQGRTVLFVSHQMNTIATLCSRCIWLEDGQIRDILPAAEAVQRYLVDGLADNARLQFPLSEDKPAQCLDLAILNRDRWPSERFQFEEDVHVEFHYVIRQEIPGLYMTCSLYGADGARLLFSDSRDDPESQFSNAKGTHHLQVTIPGGLFAPGQYSVGIVLSSVFSGRLDPDQDQRCSFSIHDVSSVRGDRRKGILALRLPWRKVEEGSCG